MAIDKLPEFAKDGQKNTDDLVLTDGFPVLKKPARQWFNWLFNTVSLKINEIIDNKIDFEDIVDNLTTDDETKPVSAKQAKKLQDEKLSKSADLSDLTNTQSARNNLGLGTAATANITTSAMDSTVGRVLKVGDGGVIEPIGLYGTQNLNNPEFLKNASWFTAGTITNGWTNGIFQTWKGNAGRFSQLGFDDNNRIFFRVGWNLAEGGEWRELIHSHNLVNTTGSSTSKVMSQKSVTDGLDLKLSKSADLSDLTNTQSARNNLGLGTAATATLTTSAMDSTVGRVLKVGDGGVIEPIGLYSTHNLNSTEFHKNASWFTAGTITNGWTNGIFQTWKGNSTRYAQIGFTEAGVFFFRAGLNIQSGAGWQRILSSGNTTTDSNGFIKAASPIVQLFADKIELNDEAQQQEITFEKLGVGDYLLKNSSGLSNDGWYIEQPKDANGNVYHAVIYEQLENGDISVKTFEQKLDGTRIVADLEKPVDIKEGRFISIRLNELPQGTTAPENPNVVDNEGNPAPSKYHYLENGEWKITAENEVILKNERYAAYQASLRPLTRRQFKLALLENGLLDQIENSISAIEDDQMRARIQIEYTEATEFHRTSDSVAYMCQLLDLTDEQVDQMWEQALTL